MLDSTHIFSKEELNEKPPIEQQLTEHSKKVERIIAHKDNDPINIQFEENGDVTKDTLVDLLSDLDGMAGVERTNRGWFRRTFFGGGDQKEVVGEQQLKTLLSGKSREEIIAIYNRVTGDNLDIKN